MKLNYRLVSVLTYVVVIISFQIRLASAQTEKKIIDAASSISVQIVTPGVTDSLVFRGSGVLIRKEGTRYYVITNSHVVDDSFSYGIRTSRFQTNPYDVTIVKRVPSVDLALLLFISNDNYPVAQIGKDAPFLSQVYVAGLTVLGDDFRWDFTSGLVTNIDNNFMQYSNQTYKGMSGGPVLDQNGFLVGIHKGKNEGVSISTIKQFLHDSWPSFDNDPLPLCSEVIFGTCRE